MIEPTFVPTHAARYRSLGGAWTGPSLDALLGHDDRVTRLAARLRHDGVRSGDVVSWQSHNRDEVALAFRACWRLGAIAAPIHHQLGSVETAALRSRLDPALVLDLDDLDAFDGLGIGVPHDDANDDVGEFWSDNETIAAVLFTSGSSGAPKGVVHSQATLAAKAVTMRTVHGITAADIVLMPAPCAHISGLLNGITLPGVAGARTVFMERWDPSRALDLIEQERVTFMVGPPTFFVSLIDAADFAPERVASLRLVSSGGAGVSPAFVERARRTLGARVKRTYGSTEAPTVATSHVDDDESHDATHDGRAVGDAELRIAPTGELLIRGPEVCLGYLDSATTAAAFDEDGWFHTGDLGTIDEGGWLTIVGRIHDMIIRGGENIAATEVEAVLEQHASVRSAAVIGIPDPRLGERVVAVVVTDDPRFDLDACRAWFAERGVARFKTPEVVEVVASLPLLASGKPDKAALRRAHSQGS